MDLLASAYDSDQDSRGSGNGEKDEPVSLPPPVRAPAPAAPVSRSNLPTAPEPKPKRKLDISILPQAIQDALLRGDAADSDDDDGAGIGGGTGTGKSRRGGVRSNQAERGQPGGDPLLKVLPAPKNAQPIPFPNASKPSPADASLSQGSRSSAPVASSTSTAAPTTTPSSSSASSALPPPPELGANPWASLSNPFALPSQIHVPPDRTAFPSTTSNTSTTPADPRYSTPYPAPEEDEDVQSPVSRKKRERELEQQLLAGDLSALKHARVTTVDTHFDWDARNYMDGQMKEVMIRKAYAGDGGSKLAAQQPNRVENRKHQLTSLAHKAAETEIALLEARSQRAKTKSQTQSKYGW